MLDSRRTLEGVRRSPDSDFPVRVSAGCRPTISWDGGAITSLSVFECGYDAKGGERWGIYSRTVQGMSSPVVYGVLPPAAAVIPNGIWTGPVVPLRTGTTYLVVLYRGGSIGSCFFRV